MCQTWGNFAGKMSPDCPTHTAAAVTRETSAALFIILKYFIQPNIAEHIYSLFYRIHIYSTVWLIQSSKNGRRSSIFLSKMGVESSRWLVAKPNSLEEKYHHLRCFRCHYVNLCLSNLWKEHCKFILFFSSQKTFGIIFTQNFFVILFCRIENLSPTISRLIFTWRSRWSPPLNSWIMLIYIIVK